MVRFNGNNKVCRTSSPLWFKVATCTCITSLLTTPATGHRAVDSSNCNTNMIQTLTEFLRYLIRSENCYTSPLIVTKLRAGGPRNRGSIQGRAKRFFAFPSHPDRLSFPVESDIGDYLTRGKGGKVPNMCLFHF